MSDLNMLTSKDIERFWSKVNIKGEDDCWEWLGNHDLEGYGKLSAFHTSFMAHRIMYFLKKEKFSEDLKILHTCDNPSCCNPNHLKLGTQKDNVQDCINKNRRSPQNGENNHRSILTEKDVKEIKRLYETGQYSYRKLGDIFGVKESTISYAIKGISWSGVGGDVIIPENKIHHKKLTSDDVIKIKEMLQEGKYRLKDIADMFETTSSNILCIKKGISWKNVGFLDIKPTTRTKLKKEDIPVIKELYKNGMSQVKIGEIYGVKKNTISQAINGVHWKENNHG